MLTNIPTFVALLFILTTIVTLIIFHWVINNSRAAKVQKNAPIITSGIIIWLAIQAFLSIQGVYNENMTALPPKIFLFGIIPTILLMLFLFLSERGRKFIDSLPSQKFTYIHLVRIPVEFGLLFLFVYNAIPQIMTFEGWNFDILMGLTAPIILYWGYNKRKISTKLILLWNTIGIVMLLFIFAIAVLSAPFPLQQLAFDQPNIGLLYFPYVWLPTAIVPLVILGHLTSIRQLFKTRI